VLQHVSSPNPCAAHLESWVTRSSSYAIGPLQTKSWAVYRTASTLLYCTPRAWSSSPLYKSQAGLGLIASTRISQFQTDLTSPAFACIKFRGKLPIVVVCEPPRSTSRWVTFYFMPRCFGSSNSSGEDQTRNTPPKQHCFVFLASQSFILKRSRFADLDQKEFSKNPWLCRQPQPDCLGAVPLYKGCLLHWGLFWEHTFWVMLRALRRGYWLSSWPIWVGKGRTLTKNRTTFFYSPYSGFWKEA